MVCRWFRRRIQYVFPQFQWSDEVPCAAVWHVLLRFSAGAGCLATDSVGVLRLPPASNPVRLRSSSRFAWSRKKLAKSRMSSRRSFIWSGMRRVNSLMRWYRSSAESPFGNALFQVFVGGTDKAYVHFDFFGRTDAADAPFLQGTQQPVFVLRSSGFLFRPERVCLRLLLRKHRLVGQCACK